MGGDHEPIERRVFETQQLMVEHPPVWRHGNKHVVYGIACPTGCTHRGSLAYSRWRAMPLPEQVDPAAAARRVEARGGFFDYEPALAQAGAVEWHVNFSDPHLFVAYGSGLLAQDEMQVAEHPALGALREALVARCSVAMTVEGGRPTPVLVMGVERRCRVATDPDPAEGRPHGLYGNAFAAAPANAVHRATTRIDPPTITNLIAMAAPSGGYGPYSEADIEHVLSTAYTGFRAAALESKGRPVAVHTGFWGCGAFGGNRVLMATLQVLAAELAKTDSLVFHTGPPPGGRALEAAAALLETDLTGRSGTRAAIERLAAKSFRWGVSDGN